MGSMLIRSSAPHPGDKQKLPVKEAKQVPSAPPVPILSCPPSSDLKPSSHLKADKGEFIPELNMGDRGPRDVVSDFARSRVPMRQQCHGAFLKHNKESCKSILFRDIHRNIRWGLQQWGRLSRRAQRLPQDDWPLGGWKLGFVWTWYIPKGFI